MRLLWVLAGAALVAIGCASTSEPAHPLTGTSWRLLSLESMSDEQGTLTFDDPAKYTVAFGANGRAAFRLDCNRGSATWQASASSTDSGHLTFGSIAVTEMGCPPPTQADKVLTALAYVRGFRLAGGRLYMSLMADGGILHWQPGEPDQPS
ncbi:META domain-containing protein [Mycolicibacterium sp. CBM1]